MDEGDVRDNGSNERKQSVQVANGIHFHGPSKLMYYNYRTFIQA